uniref:Anti-sigma factor antagonist n=1 Tax=Streptomyces griseoloalbus TaxID=67303 RepID=D1H0C3_9ACTN|nr:putative tetR family transcriptional regulator [Streptomyces albaduncus]
MRTNIIRHENMMASYDMVNGWTVVEIDGDMDGHTSPMIRDALIELIDEGHRHFILDLNFVPFLDSMGLGMIVAVTKRIRGRDGSLRIVSASSRVLRIFDLSGMRQSYEVYHSREEATRTAPTLGGLVHWPHAVSG